MNVLKAASFTHANSLGSLLAILIFIVIFGLPTTVVEASNSSSQVIRIGSVFPITTVTGLLSGSGSQRIASFMMAIKYLNEYYRDRNIVIKFAARDSKASFTNAVKAALALTTDVFNGTGVHGVVGAGDNIVSESLAFVLHDFDIAQVAYGSDLTDLSHASVYPTFTRVYPSASYEASALADIIYGRYGISTVTIVYTTDTYGIDSLAVFEARAAAIGGPAVLMTIAVIPGRVGDYSSKIKAAAVVDARAVVYLVSTAPTAAYVIEQCYTYGLFDSMTMMFATSVFASGSVWSLMTDVKVAASLSQSFIVLASADSDWKTTTAGRAFLKTFLSQKNTVFYAADGVTETCSNKTDDDGSFYLYEAYAKYNGRYSYDCDGLNFTAFAQDGSSVSPLSAFAYDATIALVHSIVGFCDTYYDGIIPDTISGVALKAYMASYTKFDGATGRIEFSTASQVIYNYGLGDRTVGVRYAAVEFTESASSTSTSSSSLAKISSTSITYTLSRFGTWISESGLVFSTNIDPLRVVRLGGVFPMTTLTDAVDPIGIQRLAAFVMAAKDLNVKYRQLNYTLQIAVRNSQRSFTNAARAALSLATTVFETRGVHGVIGAGDNSASHAMAYILQDSDIAQISYASDLSALSHNDVYHDFARVYPSSSFQGYALAEIVYLHFQYKRVVVVYTTDLYDSDAYAEFRARALDLGHVALTTIPLQPGQISGFSDAINAAKVYDPRIFVMLISDVTHAASFIREGYQGGLLSSHSLIIGTTAITSTGLWASIADPVIALNVLNTFMGLSYADTDWMVTSKGKAFLNKVRTQASTAGIYDPSTNATVCNNATDDDGNFYLYQALDAVGTAYECTGQVFSSYAADGLNMSHYAANIYDATMAMVDGIISYSKIHNGGLIPRKISGELLKAFLVSNISFDGYSGPVAFSSGRNHIVDYGVGDRVAGIRYGLLDFNPGNGSMSQFSLERFGSWSSENGFVLCADDAATYGYIAEITGACKSFILLDHLPKDHADFVVQQMPDGMRAGLLFLAALQLGICVFVGSSLVYFRKKRLMKASQPVMMWLVLSMSLWSAARTLSAAFDIDSGTCIADYWTGHLAFSGIIALFIKSLRVHLLVNAGGMKRVKISTTQVVLFTAGILGFFILYMMISTVVGTPYAAMRIRTAITGQDTHIYYCTTDIGGLDYFLYAFEAVILLLTTKLCYDTKDLPDAINETKVVAFAIFFIVVMCAIGFPLVFIVDFDPYLQQLITGVCFSMAIIFSMCIYFGPKLGLLFTGADLNAKFQIVRKDKDQKDAAEKKHAQVLLAAEAEAEASQNRKYLITMPESLDICDGLIQFLQEELLKINIKAQRGSQFSSSSYPESQAANKSVKYLQRETTMGRSQMLAVVHSDSNMRVEPPILQKSTSAVFSGNGNGGGSSTPGSGSPMRTLRVVPTVFPVIDESGADEPDGS